MKLKRNLWLLLSLTMLSLTFVCGAATPQQIKVEKLSKPRRALPEVSSEQLLRKLIVENLDTLQYIGEYTPKILAHSELPSKMVNFKYNSLFLGMFEAYADHRPFAITPDAMWLLICQGFSNHVAANSEALRDKFVGFDGVKELVITTDKRPTEADWGGFIGDFSELVAQNTKGNIAELLESNFSTTTSAERVASQATILHSMESYFRYTVVMVVCGIPTIELHGTVEDWHEILRRTRELAKYDLEWWTSELIPVLEEIARSASGDVDTSFWREMFKYHTKKQYGNPKYVDGWIVKFFPYLSSGKRSNLKEVSLGALPDEVVRVPIKFVDETTRKSYDLELCAGFFGLKQSRKSYMLTPQIGWYLYEVEGTDVVEVQSHYDNLEIKIEDSYQLPQTLFRVESIDELTLRARHFCLEGEPKGEGLSVNGEKSNGDIPGLVVTGGGFFSMNNVLIPRSLGGVKIKKLVIIGDIRRYENSIAPKVLSNEEVNAWFMKWMPGCEVEVRRPERSLQV